ncbi:MAG: hypothetical protein H0U63_05590, partial [Burkholderiales bacterium]|nr:hypothetical protein [Burkholderiales bacterium]
MGDFDRKLTATKLRDAASSRCPRFSRAGIIGVYLPAAVSYAKWYPRMWWPMADTPELHPDLAGHVRWAAHVTKSLARALFHVMARFGPKLEREQVLLGRFVDIGTE